MKPLTTLTAAAVGGLVACGEPGAPSTPPRPAAHLHGERELVSTIAFVSTRDHLTMAEEYLAAEIYLINGDGTHPRRLTVNHDGDILPALSPDGTRIVFDSNRLRAEGEPLNTSDLFVMNADGTEQTWVARGSSGTWSPDGTHIAYHASASGTARPIKADPGAATFDSDIFVLNVHNALAGVAVPFNITNNPAAVDDDPDWSPDLPDGQKIAFTSHSVHDNHNNSVTAEIYVINADGTGTPTRLIFNAEEERAPAWSPDGTRILFMCRRGPPRMPNGLPTFELCVMNADGTGEVRLTDNAVPDLTPNWSPDGAQIVFHRQPAAGQANQLWVINADGTDLPHCIKLAPRDACAVQLTETVGQNLFPNWGELRQGGAHVAAP